MLRHLSRLSLYIVHMCLPGHLRSKLLDHKLSSSSSASKKQNHSFEVPALEAEMAVHLQADEVANRKNGYGRKTIKSTTGSFELATPRDRTGSFEPQLVKKHQTHMSDEIERKIISMFGLGMSYLDIAGHIAEIYGLEISNATISSITDKLIPEIKAWQQRPLASHYPFVWLDAIHHKIKQDGVTPQKPCIRFWG